MESPRHVPHTTRLHVYSATKTFQTDGDVYIVVPIDKRFV